MRTVPGYLRGRAEFFEAFELNEQAADEVVGEPGALGCQESLLVCLAGLARLHRPALLEPVVAGDDERAHAGAGPVDRGLVGHIR